MVVPEVLTQALNADPGAKAFFDGLAPSYRRGFSEWIREAKREETRQRRLAKAMDALRAGNKSPFM